MEEANNPCAACAKLNPDAHKEPVFFMRYKDSRDGLELVAKVYLCWNHLTPISRVLMKANLADAVFCQKPGRYKQRRWHGWHGRIFGEWRSCDVPSILEKEGQHVARKHREADSNQEVSD